MSTQPRNENGQFTSTERVKSDAMVTFYISEFECRTIAGRLERASARYNKMLGSLECPVRLSQDCDYWSEQFFKACTTRKKKKPEYEENGKKRHLHADNRVRIEMTEYECWSIGNRLFEMGEWFKRNGHEKIAQESQWLARRFHAERNEVIEE